MVSPRIINHTNRVFTNDSLCERIEWEDTAPADAFDQGAYRAETRQPLKSSLCMNETLSSF